MAKKTTAKDKRLGDLSSGKPAQMDLFELIEPGDDRYSNTIEIYDALPKYTWERREYDSLENAISVRECTLRGQKLTVKIKPAIIEKDDGRTVLIYPSVREELVEDALRKLAVTGRGRLLDGDAGVIFTLYELQMELARNGHGFNINEIKEAIHVCRGASIECSDDEGRGFLSSNFFQMIGLTTRKDWQKRTSEQCYVQFNPLVTKSILDRTYRPYNYHIGMSIRSPLARFIYKRMSHYWTQASPEAPYTPTLVGILTQSPRGLSKRMPENVRAMKNALDVLIRHEVISNYEAVTVKDGRFTKDVRYTVWPHERFVTEIKKANWRQRKKQMQAMTSGHELEDQAEPVTQTE